MAVPSLNYKGDATFIISEKNGNTYRMIQPSHISTRIFLQENCTIVGLPKNEQLISGTIYNVEISCFARINDKGYLNLSAYLLNVLA